MNKVIYIVALYCFLFCNAKFASGQFISLNKNEIEQLKTIIQQDNSAQKVFGLLEKEAKIALEQEPQPIDVIISEGLLNLISVEIFEKNFNIRSFISFSCVEFSTSMLNIA